MKARVTVTLKSGVLDPQGKAIQGALGALGIEGVTGVRQGKIFDVEFAAADEAGANALLRRACERLLANTVIENYRYEIQPDTAEPGPPLPAAATADPFTPDEAVTDDEDETSAESGDDEAEEGDEPARSAASEAEMPPEGHP
jgi:phosphoribosylformylglycinamidine synthase subunit PurS